MSTAELLERRGLERGLKRGRAEGLEEGMARGLYQGRSEGSYQKAIESARKMLARGYDINEICELTSLTREQVEKLTF